MLIFYQTGFEKQGEKKEEKRVEIHKLILCCLCSSRERVVTVGVVISDWCLVCIELQCYGSEWLGLQHVLWFRMARLATYLSSFRTSRKHVCRSVSCLICCA